MCCGGNTGVAERYTLADFKKGMAMATGEKPEKVLIVYQGGRYDHPVQSPTGILFTKYGIENYGMHRGGDVFDVLVEDYRHDRDNNGGKFKLPEGATLSGTKKKVVLPGDPSESPPPNPEDSIKAGAAQVSDPETGGQAPSNVPPESENPDGTADLSKTAARKPNSKATDKGE